MLQVVKIWSCLSSTKEKEGREEKKSNTCIWNQRNVRIWIIWNIRNQKIIYLCFKRKRLKAANRNTVMYSSIHQVKLILLFDGCAYIIYPSIITHHPYFSRKLWFGWTVAREVGIMLTLPSYSNARTLFAHEFLCSTSWISSLGLIRYLIEISKWFSHLVFFQLLVFL